LCKMKEDLKKRKADFEKYLDKELENKPQRWWQQRRIECTATKDVGNGKNNYLQNPDETIVKYDFERALTSGALFFGITFLSFLYAALKEGEFPASFWIINSIVFILVCHPLVKRSNKGPLMIFNKYGFWIYGIDKEIPWHCLAASYIKKDDTGESPNYFLVIFYYDETIDEFVKNENNIDGLDMNKEDIASTIEYWKKSNNIVTFDRH
jgi:hypothetical protein